MNDESYEVLPAPEGSNPGDRLYIDGKPFTAMLFVPVERHDFMRVLILNAFLRLYIRAKARDN